MQMSFLSNIKLSFLICRRTDLRRKEQDSSQAQHINIKSSPLVGRASAFTSKGSMTVEAAFVVSFFFFAALCLAYLLEIMALQTSMKNALCAVGKELAVEAYTKPMIPTTQMEQRIAEQIGSERLNNSLVMDGSAGLDCSDSKKYWNTTIMDLTVKYRIEIPIMMLRIRMPWQEITIRIKGWTGHERKTTADTDSTMVYVTDYGLVYHRDMYCTYLELSIRVVNRDEVEALRNAEGSKYKACLSCGGENSSGKVYVTDYGERYHSSLECSGLKRNIYAVPLSDVKGLGGCSKCVN